MFRVSPLNYMIEGLAARGLANLRVTCSAKEMLHIRKAGDPPLRTCGEYLEACVGGAGGYVANPGDVSDCQDCAVENNNAVLRRFGNGYTTAVALRRYLGCLRRIQHTLHVCHLLAGESASGSSTRCTISREDGRVVTQWSVQFSLSV